MPEVELFEGSASLFSKASEEAAIQPKAATWFHHARLKDGSDYLRWSGLFEFLISADGRWIAARPLTDASHEAFQAYLLGQVLSFSLLRQGIEPLHATVVAIGTGAAAFLGHSGFGKSTLAAALLHAGSLLLTDDLLVLKEEGDNFFAYPGPPRIKLFPEVANTFLREGVMGAPMNPYTPKLVIPLSPRLSSQSSASLLAIYVLRPPAAGSQSQRITIRTLGQRQSLLALIATTFNTVIREPERLARQFDLAARLAASVSVKSLSYPRDLSRLPAVVEAILSDLTQRRRRRSRISDGHAL